VSGLTFSADTGAPFLNKNTRRMRIFTVMPEELASKLSLLRERSREETSESKTGTELIRESFMATVTLAFDDESLGAKSRGGISSFKRSLKNAISSGPCDVLISTE